MHLNKTKFERKSSLEYYHMTCIAKTKIMQAKEVYCQFHTHTTTNDINVIS